MYYPIFLDLKDQRCLVVGSGNVARRKAQTLRQAGAKVTVLDPLSLRGGPKGRRGNPVGISNDTGSPRSLRELAMTSLSKFFLVVTAASDRAFNSKIAKACFKKNILVNTVDDPELCNFIVPSRFKQGPLQIAVSTEGASPVLARHIRKTLQKQWGKSWAEFLRFLEIKRRKIMKTVTNPAKRRKIFMKAASRKIVSLVNQGKLAQAKREFLKEK